MLRWKFKVGQIAYLRSLIEIFSGKWTRVKILEQLIINKRPHYKIKFIDKNLLPAIVDEDLLNSQKEIESFAYSTVKRQRRFMNLTKGV